ncbi:MAG: translation initiation factor IF-2 [Desulfopila sp.]|nr:translation initiation factor IF-2 [Desulfopila sp.]
MSRVRIYELAKEAGMSSKDLASKLIEQGYDVKGHSSTVDDDTAEKIRETVLKKSETELVEKRISGAAGSTVIRRRSTIIRRKGKASLDETDQEPDTLPEEPEEGESVKAQQPALQEDETAAESVETKDTGHGRREDSENLEIKEEEQQEEEGGEVDVPASAEAADESQTEAEDEEIEESPVSSGEDSEPVEAEKVPEIRETEESIPVAVDEDEETPKKGKEKKKSSKKGKPDGSRKNFARVVGTIEIPVEEEKPSPPRPKRKPIKANIVGAPERDVDLLGKDVPVEDGRPKKKGRKSAVLEPDDELSRKGKKGGKKSVKYTHFGAEYQRSLGKRGKKGGKGRRDGRQSAQQLEMKASKKRIKVYDSISVGDLAAKMRVKASEVIAKLMGLGVMATMNQSVDVETAMLIATDFGYEVEQGVTEEIGIQMLDQEQEGGDRKPRAPVVTVMGHVDHGKTSILDAIRKTDVAEGEAGGITQHIGAYHVKSAAGDVTFVDTPGHAAFTEMRARGAQVTDIVVLVVAADDGVMDQTREAIHHAQAAGVPIIVAVNKIDKDNADPDRVKRELAELDLSPEEWGGQTIYCETSAKKNIGIDNLLENIQLMAEILELEADPNRKAKGRVIEAKLDKGRGAVATVMVQEGTLKAGDYFVVGHHSGKVRAMSDYKGRKIKTAGPSTPVEVQGMSGVPSAGDEFIVVTDEKMAKNVSNSRSLKARESELGAHSKISLDKLFEQMNDGDVKELRVVLRADVQGTLEAFAKAAQELSTDEIKVRVLHEGTGTITESDILLASASEAIIIGFNVRPTVKVKDLAQKESVDVRAYDVIYHALDDIRKAMVGMLDPTFEENVIGTAEVRETFSVPKVGTIAGSFVNTGKMKRNAKVRVVRDGVVMYTGKIGSLRRFKDDVKEVLSGFECGIGVENYNDIKVGDTFEAFVMEQVEATLSSEKK